MNTNESHIDILIARVLSGEASGDEYRELDQWRDLSKENNDYFLDMQQLHLWTQAHAHSGQFDVDAAWLKVKSQTIDQPKVVKMESRMGQWMRIAAAAVVLIGIGVSYYVFFSKAPQQWAFETKNEISRDTLADGSLAVLNENTTLGFTIDDEKKERRVRLKGEAFFKIQEDTTKTFVIESEELLIRDIGTAFNVKALENSDTVEVYVKEGLVQMYTSELDGILIEAGETGLFIRSEKRFEKSADIQNENPEAYATGDFKFRNARLERVAHKLSRYFKVDIAFQNESLKNCHIDITFQDDELSTILDVITESLGLTWSETNGQYLIKGECH